MTPPRLARWLLSALLPARHRRVVVDDLDEELRLRTQGEAGWRSRLWYWRQAIGSVPSALRLRQSAPGTGRATPGASVSAFVADLRFGLRLVRRRPGTTAAGMVTLGAGIAVSTAVMSVAHAVLLRPLPYDNPDALVAIQEIDTRRESSSGNLSWLDLRDYRDGVDSFVSLAAYNGGSRTLIGAGRADRVTITEITPNFFETLGVAPMLGRDLVEADSAAGAPPVLILSEPAWRARFGADPEVVGRLVQLNGASATVVGVLPADFEFPLRGLAEMFVPLRPSDAQLERRYFHWVDVIGRLKPGVTLEEGQADLAAVARSFAAIDPEYHPSADVAVLPLSELIVGDVRPMLLALLAASLFVMLIACSAVTGLLVSRSTARSRELGVRAAIGATRRRLVRQLLTEGLVLAAGALAIGLVSAGWLVKVFIALLPEHQRVALPHLSDVGLAPSTVGTSVGVALVAAGVSALVPAWRFIRGRSPLTPRTVVGGGLPARRLQAGLVAGQVAFAMVLLSGAGLMLRSVANLAAVSPGFETRGLLTMRLTMTGERYPDGDAVLATHARLMEAIASLPGVTGVATINQLPLTGQGNTGTFQVDGATSNFPDSTRLRTVTADYFEVMGIPLRRGRPFTGDDRRDSARAVLVNESFARGVFGDSAIGRRVTFAFFEGQPEWEIVGVVGNERFDGVEQPFGPVVYFHYGQTPERGVSVVVRTTGRPDPLVPGVEAVVAAVDPNLPLFAVRSMDSILGESDSVFRRRAMLLLIGVFAVASVFLAGIGLFGVVSQVVLERTREFGVRLTLGADGPHIAGLVLRQGLWPAAAGLGIGLLGSLVFGRVIATLLFETTPHDPATLAMVGMVLVLVCGTACLTPAWRAIRIDPVRALARD